VRVESPARPSRLAIATLLLALTGLLPAPAAPAPPRGASEPRLRDVRPERQLWGTVTQVGGGPQLVLRTPEGDRLDVRLLGIEMPEPPSQNGGPAPGSGQPYGHEAATYLQALLLDKQVLLEPHGQDRSGRLQAVVYLGEINVNLTLVKEGLAWVSPGKTVPRVRAPLQVAERQAQVARWGLWALPDPEPPWEYRKRHGLPKD
jgi:endonuclease YncB( thermonuclease family)